MAGISKEESLRRHRIVESAIGTHVMEGLEPDAITRQIMQRYAGGELTMDQFSDAMEAHAHSLLPSNVKLAVA